MRCFRISQASCSIRSSFLYLSSSSSVTSLFLPATQLSIADIAIVAMLGVMKKLDHMDPELLTPHPTLAALVKTVTEEPKIAAFIAKHAK